MTRREVRVGPVTLGGGNPVLVQSMTNTPTADVDATVAQIDALAAAGCEMVRVAVSSTAEVRAFGDLRQRVALPLIADIQFNWRFAVDCLGLGADKVRVNPGNIGTREEFLAVVDEAGRRGKALRIGINSGSLEADLLAEHGGPTPAAMNASARRAVATAEATGFRDLVVSLKSSGVMETVEAYRLFAVGSDVPLHLGVTEAGDAMTGAIKSAVAFGLLLDDGIGDTLRVSLTAPPETEVRAAWDILGALGLRRRGVNIVSCPTCSRCRMDIIGIAAQVKERLRAVDEPLTVAVMGCSVNGPGEAREADIGLAGGVGKGVLFRKGVVLRDVPERQCVETLVAEVLALVKGGSVEGEGEDDEQQPRR
jgi:(E)-4-hydroxy-3-methylbut-2-enyl-diphosphate synthase